MDAYTENRMIVVRQIQAERHAEADAERIIAEGRHADDAAEPAETPPTVPAPALAGRLRRARHPRMALESAARRLRRRPRAERSAPARRRARRPSRTRR